MRAGIYKHYKGPLYLTIGLAHDANADTLFDAVEDLQFPHGRTVVVYVPLQLDDAHAGPRMAVRTEEDFFSFVCTNQECSNYGKDEGGRMDFGRQCGKCEGTMRQRFTFVGEEYVP